MGTREVDDLSPPGWTNWVLWAAAFYNLAWGTWVVMRPGDLFAWSEIDPPIYPGIWQCVGMIVGVYGIGYAIAATHPYRHWPIVLVGLLGKLFGPIGFISSQWFPPEDSISLPLSWGVTLITNDLIWWLPFAIILLGAFRYHASVPDADTDVLTVAQANAEFVTQHGVSLADLSEDQTVLVLFLRHSGCTFCREALADLAMQLDTLKQRNIVPVVVHMGDNSDDKFLAAFGLEQIHRISDPNRRLYRAYDLIRGTYGQLLGPRVLWRGFKAAIWKRYGVGKLVGDGFQMPGVFLIRNGKILTAFRHKTSADRPDYCELTEAAV